MRFPYWATPISSSSAMVLVASVQLAVLTVAHFRPPQRRSVPTAGVRKTNPFSEVSMVFGPAAIYVPTSSASCNCETRGRVERLRMSSSDTIFGSFSNQFSRIIPVASSACVITPFGSGASFFGLGAHWNVVFKVRCCVVTEAAWLVQIAISWSVEALPPGEPKIDFPRRLGLGQGPGLPEQLVSRDHPVRRRRGLLRLVLLGCRPRSCRVVPPWCQLLSAG